MTTSNNKKQKLFIQDILSSPEIYNKTSGILLPEYFTVEYQSVVKHIHEYYGKYNATPAIDQLNASFDVDLEETKRVTKDRVQSTCDEIEQFCRETAVKEAIFESLQDIEDQEMGAVLDRISKAVQISLERDTGMDIWENPEERLHALVDNFTPIPTGIQGIDGPLDGGLIRKQFTLFSANSGGGKSLMLVNIARNYSLQGLNVVCITLELAEEMQFLRAASMLSGLDASTWRLHIPEIAEKIVEESQDAGSFVIKYMDPQSTANDIQSYLSFYEMEYDRVPDVLIIDYLDQMAPNAGTRNVGVFEQDKNKSEEVTKLLKKYNMIGISASQQNRDAVRIDTPDHAVIAGGISKINTVDNYISLFMDGEMRTTGEMMAYFLKTRSSAGVNHCSMLKYNGSNLRISDMDEGPQVSVMPKRKKKAVSPQELMDELNPKPDVAADIDGLPGTDETSKNEIHDLFEEDKVSNDVEATEADKLMGLMTSLSEGMNI